VLWGWPRFLHNQPLHKRKSARGKLPFPFALWHCVDEVVGGKHNSVYPGEVCVRRCKRASLALVDKTWPHLCYGARSLRSATKEWGMRVPGLGETNAHICDEEVEQILRYLHGNALLLVSCHLSHAVHPDKFSHSEHSPFLDKQDNGDSSALVMPDEMPLCQDMRRAGRHVPRFALAFLERFR